MPSKPSKKEVVPTLAGKRPIRTITPALPPSAVSPPAAAAATKIPAPAPNRAPRDKGRSKTTPKPLAIKNPRPLSQYPELENLARTRVKDLEYIFASTDEAAVENGQEQALRDPLEAVQTAINALRSITPERRPGFGPPGGNSASFSVVTAAKGPTGGVQKTVKRSSRMR